MSRFACNAAATLIVIIVVQLWFLGTEKGSEVKCLEASELALVGLGGLEPQTSSMSTISGRFLTKIRVSPLGNENVR